MSVETTFSLIKPDAVRQNHSGLIIDAIIKAHFRIEAMKLYSLRKREAKTFYAVHKDKSFFNDLIAFITSGPVIAMVLERDNAVQYFRSLIGNTNPKRADGHTIRAKFGKSIDSNAIHGSDSKENAIVEANFFFSKFEYV